MSHSRDLLAHVLQCSGLARPETESDLQYAGPNPVAFDIANHWCEYGADYHTDLPHLLDYSRMPSPHQQVLTLPLIKETESLVSMSLCQHVGARCGLHAPLYILSVLLHFNITSKLCMHCITHAQQQHITCETLADMCLFWRWH